MVVVSGGVGIGGFSGVTGDCFGIGYVGGVVVIVAGGGDRG